jgi:hypothetical protein
MDEHLPDRPGVEVELADLLLRVADEIEALGLDVAGAIIDKNRYSGSWAQIDLKQPTPP